MANQILKGERVQGVLQPDKPYNQFHKETHPYSGWRSPQERVNKRRKKMKKKIEYMKKEKKNQCCAREGLTQGFLNR